jgi:hypothetical protein
MVHLKNLNSSIEYPDGTSQIIRKGTWVCRACTGEEYFAKLKGQNDNA